MVGLVGGPRGGEFWKICKIFLKKIARKAVFSPILKDTSKPIVKLSRVWTKNTTGWGNFEQILGSFNENAIETLNFYLFLRKFVAKI